MTDLQFSLVMGMLFFIIHKTETDTFSRGMWMLISAFFLVGAGLIFVLELVLELVQ
jgi:hypothetical protein